ncbi:hypothetical protein F5Y15DRAFT_141665 [Xylariaceae sp. FL0016]|nr:hypothetical protein F5Y15DRAFT_141665 [Xylariaceae sp. FL0016]
MAATADSQPCNRCKEHDATLLDLRTERVCRTCFATFVSSKIIKRLEVLQRETRGVRLPSRPQRYLLALSLGPSSTALLAVLAQNLARQRQRGQRAKFELVVAHVSTSSSEGEEGEEEGDGNEVRDIARFRAAFPAVEIAVLPLSRLLTPEYRHLIAWSALPPLAPEDALPPPQRLSDLLSRLPSASSRADVTRLLTRHLLIAHAARSGCDVLLLGYNTTALAELTLAETAKGRGRGLPWLVNDGMWPLPRSLDAADVTDGEEETGASADTTTTISSSPNERPGRTSSLPIYSPLRDLFRKELLLYLRHPPDASAATGSSSGSSPDTPPNPLPSLFPPSILDPSLHPRPSVISHKDLSIDAVMSRYFADVEASYPSVVANVVRTTGKLRREDDGHGAVGEAERATSSSSRCGLCGTGLDAEGDARWKGEIGETDLATETETETERSGSGDGNGGASRSRANLCYGCERSVRG